MSGETGASRGPIHLQPEELRVNPMQVVGVLGGMSLQEWQWERNCLEMGKDTATQLYTRELAATAEILQKQSKEEAAVLRADVAASLLSGDSLSPLFPDHDINASTERLLAVCLSEELRLAGQVQQYRTLAEWEPRTLIDRLTAHLPPLMRWQFEEVVMSFDEVRCAQFLRYCAGEPLRWLRREHYGIKRPLNESSINRSRMNTCIKALGRAGIDLKDSAVLPRLYPSCERQSIFYNLPQHIGIINKEAERLACRIDSSEFELIALSLSDQTAWNIGQILTVYNSPVLAVSSGPQELRYNAHLAYGPYKEHFGGLIDTLRPRNPKHLTNIETTELEEMIARVMQATKNKKYAPLTLDQESALAKQIELGTWAEIRMAWAGKRDLLQNSMRIAISDYAQKASLVEVSDKELSCLIHEGREALETLLHHNSRLAFMLMARNARKFGTDEDLSSWHQAGLRALVRTLYKFDYTKSYKIGTYFGKWARAYANEMAAKERNITTTQWSSIGAVIKKEADLLQVLYREPTDEEVRESLGWSLKRFQQTKAIRKEVGDKNRPVELSEALMRVMAKKEVCTSDEASPQEEDLSFQEYADLFAHDPRKLDIIRLRFDQHYELDEIATVFNMTEEKVMQHLDESFAMIKQHLLTKDNLYDDIFDIG